MKEISLKFIGDIFPGDEIFTCGFGIKSKTTNANEELWIDDIKKTVGEADYIIGNLESPLINDELATNPTFYGKPAFANILQKAGVNVLNVANNHILEHGDAGFNYTIKTLYENGQKVVGKTVGGNSEVVLIEEHGTKICMAGFCDERVCHDNNNGNYYAPLREQWIFNALDLMDGMGADIKIFIFHWGNEYINIPSPDQRSLAYKLIDAGADLIIGHHPHVIQPYEKYKHGHIVYSLGNFCFDSILSKNFSVGMIADIIINECKIQNVKLRGATLCDMIYTDHLTSGMTPSAFDDFYKAKSDYYYSLIPLSMDDYGRLYYRSHKSIHLRERIRMKTKVLSDVFDIRNRYKCKYFTNTTVYVKQKIYKNGNI